MSVINFTPGPSQLYFTVEGHVRQAFREGIPSISHRSKTFEHIYTEVKEGLTTLLQLPTDYQVLFAASATEIWERSLQNLAAENSFHFVNGAFSRRYYEIAAQLKKNPAKAECAEGESFAQWQIHEDADFVALTHNETSTGVALPLEHVHAISATTKAIVAVDAVSSLPYPVFDFDRIDTLFFSVQKAFGLPAGLGVWMVNSRCIAKAEQLTQVADVGTYHSIPSLTASAKKNQTPETPNVLGIYLLAKVIDDFNRRGIETIRRETDYKAALLYQVLDQHPQLNAFVTDKTARSKTVIVANTGAHTRKLAQWLQAKGMQAGDGYGAHKENQLRFANFPTHSKEQYEMLADLIAAFEG